MLYICRGLDLDLLGLTNLMLPIIPYSLALCNKRWLTLPWHQVRPLQVLRRIARNIKVSSLEEHINAFVQ